MVWYAVKQSRVYTPKLPFLFQVHAHNYLSYQPVNMQERYLFVLTMQAELLTGLPVADMASARETVRTLQLKGPGCVVLTLGEKGSIFSQRETNDIKHIKSTKVDVVDTTVIKALTLQHCV